MNFLGRFGESLVSDYLLSGGGKVIKNNFRCPLGEVDIIYRDKHNVVFVEVKTWRCYSWEMLAEVINEKKQRKICKVAEYFLECYPEYLKYVCRIDVVLVQVEPLRIHHLTDAFDTWEESRKK